MTVTVSRWGNSLGLRIPKAALEEARLAEGDQVSVTVETGQLVIRKKPRVDLADLVSRITPENRHDEQIPSTVGNEAW